MINIELYEATGPLKEIDIVDNLNWKSLSAEDATYPYYQYPIRRPNVTDNSLYEVSYVKYVYAVITGTYTKAKRVRWNIEGPTDLDTKLFYKLTNSYISPNQNLMGTGTLINSQTNIFPCISSVSPELATSRIMNLSPDTTYYTNYLVTQLYVKRGVWNNVGNTTPIKIQLLVDDYE